MTATLCLWRIPRERKRLADAITALHKRGFTDAQIADAMGLDRHRLRRWRLALGLTPNPARRGPQPGKVRHVEEGPKHADVEARIKRYRKLARKSLPLFEVCQ